MVAMKSMEGQAHLMQIVLAFEPVGRFANLLHGRQQQTNQDADDGNDYQKLN
jgi:hypothetical protein